MATFNLWNYCSLVADGTETFGKQGETTDSPQQPFSVTVTGDVFVAKHLLATATVRKLWDSTMFPATFAYLHFWADQICYLQLIASATNCTHKIAAKQPFVLPGYSTQLSAANTTPITGGAEPAVTAMGSIYLGNYSGSDVNYALKLVL